AHPGDANYQCLLARCYGGLGWGLVARGQWRQAEEIVDRALKLLQPADRAPPSTGKDYRYVLAMNQTSRALVYLRTNRPALAEKNLREGVTGYEQMVRNHPKHLLYRIQLLMSYLSLAEVYEQMSDSAQAENTWKKGSQLAAQMAQDYPTLPWLSWIAD